MDEGKNVDQRLELSRNINNECSLSVARSDLLGLRLSMLNKLLDVPEFFFCRGVASCTDPSYKLSLSSEAAPLPPDAAAAAAALTRRLELLEVPLRSLGSPDVREGLLCRLAELGKGCF